eukprot:TRINITY_DN3429_c0_g1_i1.p1 TRINITY_DN3429_c0_g1~~TRINITY_DN3429_c0_g1_i1.p1  ORF type:complete len:419 (+),score=122.00 TRINITY_DN3429_c0_g1_i1:134-1390(+)
MGDSDESLEEILGDPQLALLFWGHLEQAQCVELLNFWLEIEELHTITGGGEIIDRCREIDRKYFGNDCPLPVQSTLISEMKSGHRYGPYIYDKIQKEVFYSLRIDSFPNFLKSGLYQNYRSNKGKTQIHKICEKGTVEALKKHLRDYGGNINARDLEHWTPLHCAASAKNLEICKFLMENGADPRVLTKRTNNTPLHFIAKVKANDEKEKELHLLIMQMMVDFGAKVNIQNGKKEVPLHIAAISSRAYTVQFLIQNHADVNIVNDNGETALHHAVMTGKEDTVQLLLEKGADPNVKSKTHGTPSQLAYKGRFKNIEETLLDWMRKQTPLKTTPSKKVKKLSQIILQTTHTPTHKKKSLSLWIPPEKAPAPGTHNLTTIIPEFGELCILERKMDGSSSDFIRLLEAHIERQITTIYELV